MLLRVTEVHYRSSPETWTSTPIIPSTITEEPGLVVLSILSPSQRSWGTGHHATLGERGIYRMCITHHQGLSEVTSVTIWPCTFSFLAINLLLELSSLLKHTLHGMRGHAEWSSGFYQFSHFYPGLLVNSVLSTVLVPIQSFSEVFLCLMILGCREETPKIS